MLKVLSTSTALIFLFVSSAMAQTGSTGACAADIKKGLRQCRARRWSYRHLRQGKPYEPFRCVQEKIRRGGGRGKCVPREKQCSTVTRYIQKVACIKDALTNLGDDCKAATASVVTRKQ
jgi:hypothetical protein